MAEGYKDWSAGDILTAADLEDYTVKQSVMRFADSSARTSALSGVLAEGMMSYLKDTNTVEVYDGSAWAAVAGGKILQVVRATDGTQRTTTSTSFVDASLSVTITPQKSDSAILLMWTARLQSNAGSNSAGGNMQIADSSNNPISGAEIGSVAVAGNGLTTALIDVSQISIGYATPATTSAVTYKARFRKSAGTAVLENDVQTGQMFALEISA
jgi:hypothetical protein